MTTITDTSLHQISVTHNDAETWPDHLRRLINNQWRPVEWDQQARRFQADPANPLTAASLCRVQGCGCFTNASSALCSSCRKQYSKRGSGDIAEFLAGYSIKYRKYNVQGTFSLDGLSDLLATEVQYALQVRDEQMITLSPDRVRTALGKLPPRLPSLLELDSESVAGLNAANAGFINAITSIVRHAYQAFTGADPTVEDVWDCALVGLIAAPNRRYRAVTGTIDFTMVHQPWLRDLIKHFGRDSRPPVTVLRRTLGATELASQALLVRPNGNQPSKLSMADMTAIVGEIRASTNVDGSARSSTHRRGVLGYWRRMIEYCRQAGYMDDIPGSFVLNPRFHFIDAVEINEGEAGRAIPELVIAQLNSFIDLLGSRSGFSQGGWASADFACMYQTIYQILRDTGRRPGEVAALKRGCIDRSNGKPTLIYDNLKRRRHGRRLPVSESTATIIDSWLKRLSELPAVHGCDEWLFPSPGARNRQQRGHVNAAHFGNRVWDEWLNAIPGIYDEGLNADGSPIPFPRERLTPYGLRHAFAQRHADAGTPVDVLRDLMDHRSVDTTMGYYQVSLDRRRDAVATVSRLVVDRHGTPQGFDDPLAYERDSVTVPFGGCTERSNVQAGGGHCRIRFQCAGCGFYRPDPSYIPAIEQHVSDLRSDRELADASDADRWVLDNIDSQIDAFNGVTDAMRRKLANLPDDEREAVEAASRELRKARQAAAFIPLTALTRRSE